MANFRANAELAARLKPYGRVQINVSTLPDKCWYTVPEGGSSWHEYASYNPTFFKFFPHPKVAPFIPADLSPHTASCCWKKRRWCASWGWGPRSGPTG